ncbi:chromosome transmission fidelity protein 18 homolog [Culicoides brevitarsis]|uniref:chromosome transmission fidelity protein 18 homolog n=1 Tax=Culicoides brevitarsis TaxID=469753 RepID=UPI00307C198F
MTEPDDFDLQYADELEMIEEVDEDNPNDSNVNVFPSTPGVSRSINMTPFQPASSIDSPLMSQINKNLEDSSFRGGKRFASTPFPGGGRSSASNSHEGMSRKRRLDDIFGDIGDICEEEEPQITNEPYKKAKSEEEKDMELIEMIVNARKKLHSQMLKPGKRSNIEHLDDVRAFKMQNLSYTVPKWPFIKLRQADEDKIYVRCHSEEFEKNQLKEIAFKRQEDGFFGEDKSKIWNEASEINAKRMLRTTQSQEDEQPVEVFETGDMHLWVEQYKPRTYIDLLSDESCNKNLLKWIKLWDKVVFNREVPSVDKKPKAQQKLNTFNKKTGRFEQTGGWIKKNRWNLNTELDENGRPMQRIALLCGPPGLGKTTLALTVAKHAGYNVVEINASDDRTPETFRLALESSTQMKSVFSNDRRPNCIVLDEIDGAPSSSIDFLLRFAAGITKKGKKKDLNRPIICICNDPYVASLRLLRQQAFVINVPQTDSAKLVDRLLQIAKMQKIRVDMSTLFALAEKTGNDIRSCLSLLQFFSCTKKEITLMDVIRSNVGQKDQQKELYSIWRAIFQIQRPSKAQITQQEQSQGAALTTLTPDLRLEYVVDTVSKSFDYEKLMQGVFENYLYQKQPDPNLKGLSEAADWFSYDDLLQTAVHHSQNYSLYGYLAYSFAAWHFLFATLAWPKINFPNKSYEISQKLLTTKNILSALRKNLEATKRGIGDTQKIMNVDSLPFVKLILNPCLRSVSLHLLTPKEKTDVHDTVEIMADLGISFIQLKTAEGNYKYQLEPDIESLAKFYDTLMPGLSYWAKQLIAREVDIERMRRVQIKSKSQLQNDNFNSTNKKDNIKSSNVPQNDENLPNFLRTLQPKAIAKPTKEKEVTRKDFFGRVTTAKSGKLASASHDNDNIVKGKIWYCYKEGFNNAVRKPITMSELI